jgi:hypothetical protein
VPSPSKLSSDCDCDSNSSSAESYSNMPDGATYDKLKGFHHFTSFDHRKLGEDLILSLHQAYIRLPQPKLSTKQSSITQPSFNHTPRTPKTSRSNFKSHSRSFSIQQSKESLESNNPPPTKMENEDCILLNKKQTDDAMKKHLQLLYGRQIA